MSSLLGGGPAYADPRTDNLPLNQQEQQLVQKLLGDPISFPMVFKSWLVSFLEISDIALPQTSIVGLSAVLGTDPGESGTLGILTTGSCVLWAGATLPANSVACNGALYDVTVYPELFKAIGNRHGGTVGSTFGVPNIPPPVANTQWVIVT